MYFPVSCSCGRPLGHLFRLYTLAVLFSYQTNYEEFIEYVRQLKTAYGDQFPRILDFLHTSIEHFSVY